MAGTFEGGAVESALRKGPEGVRAFVMVSEGAIAGTDDNELEALVLDASERIRGEISEPQREHGRTSHGVFEDRVHKESGREAR